MSSLFYFFKESLQGFARNLSTTLGSIITIFLSLLIIGVFLVGGTIVERLVSSIEDEVSITAYVADDAPQESIDAVTAMIQGMDGVESVGFTTKEQALENFSNSMTTNPEIIEQLDGTNPLPAPTNPQIKPTPAPQSSDCTNRFWALTAFMAFFVVMTGRTMNLTPSKKVMKVENPPIVVPGTRLAT